VRTYINRFGVAPGKRAVVFASCDDGWGTAENLAKAGIEVTALVDARKNTSHRRDARWPLFAGAVVERARGGHRLRSVTIRVENGAKTDDLCLARQSELKLGREDLAALRRLAGFAQGLGEVASRAGAGAFDFDALQQAAGFDAFPVHIVHYRDGARAHEMTLKAIARTAIAPATFEVPSGTSKVAIARTAIAPATFEVPLSAMEDGHFLYWTVWHGNDAIGSLDLSALDFAHMRGEIGFLFRRDQWGRGYGREAMGALVHHAFHRLKLERLEAKVHAANMPAKKLLSLLGFAPEGRLKGYVRRGGIRQDVDVFGLLNLSSTQNGA